ncbi:hypothetical protein Aab01nite_50790 [Paractinoplanes abujensis]|uniref:DUF4345 domain-containing protein n=1 Tax=Paractinoplanes abujensis TaxID=882441 RepID=A0A7W7CSG6_9ACTN|nr:hypothetical protein [Actinoplanes abujensis]MBB4693853.1 hypothetical protein [Actinoplanes abujensis]GID21489.1 hypothetical protein Aab01nite_50790 [Actinoplanes abujensis]
MNLESARRWLRGGLYTLAALQTFVSLWQYFLPRSFFDDFPTVKLDPPYNEHLLTDVGGLGLALAATLAIAAWLVDTRVALAALTGYLVYAATHFAYHVTHFADFSLGEALGVGTGLGLEVVLALLLLHTARLLLRAGRAMAGVDGPGRSDGERHAGEGFGD